MPTKGGPGNDDENCTCQGCKAERPRWATLTITIRPTGETLEIEGEVCSPECALVAMREAATMFEKALLEGYN
jgi:hypothetical protein